METLMENDGAINGEWRKINGTWWTKWKMTENEWNMMEKLMEHIRKLMEHDGTTNVTWKKTNGKSRKRTRTWKKTNRKLKTAKNKNNNKSWKKHHPNWFLTVVQQTSPWYGCSILQQCKQLFFTTSCQAGHIKLSNSLEITKHSITQQLTNNNLA